MTFCQVSRPSKRWKAGKTNPRVFIKRVKGFKIFSFSLLPGLIFHTWCLSRKFQRALARFWRSGLSESITVSHLWGLLLVPAVSQDVIFDMELLIFSHLTSSKCSETIFRFGTENSLLILQIENWRVGRRGGVPSVATCICNRLTSYRTT